MDKKIFSPTLYPLNRDMSKTWFIKYKDEIGRVHKSYGHLNHFQTAKERLKEFNRMLTALQAPEKKEAIQKNGLIKNLSDALEFKGPSLSKKSYQCYFSYLKKFSTWYNLERAKNKDIAPEYFIRQLYVEQFHNNYIRKFKTVLQSLFQDIIKKGQYKENPFKGIKVRKLKGQSLLPFHKNQIAVLKNEICQADQQLYEAIQFLFYLYFRPKEIRLLKIRDILFDEMKVAVVADMTKDKDVYLKAIPTVMQPMIEKYRKYPPHFYVFGRDGQPSEIIIGTNTLYNRHRVFLKRLNFSDRFSLYSWVHTGIKEAVMAGIPIKQLQLQKGHSDLKMFDEYLKNIGVNDCEKLVLNFPEL